MNGSTTSRLRPPSARRRRASSATCCSRTCCSASPEAASGWPWPPSACRCCCGWPSISCRCRRPCRSTRGDGVHRQPSRWPEGCCSAPFPRSGISGACPRWPTRTPHPERRTDHAARAEPSAGRAGRAGARAPRGGWIDGAHLPVAARRRHRVHRRRARADDDAVAAGLGRARLCRSAAPAPCVQERLAGAPGSTTVSFASRVPLGATGPAAPSIRRRAPPDGAAGVPLRRARLLPHDGHPLVAGRSFDWTDQDGARRVAMVSESWARTMWGSAEAALGKGVRMGDGRAVGRDCRRRGRRAPRKPRRTARGHRLPDAWPGGMAPFMSRTVTFVVRSDRVGTPGFVESLQRAVWSLEPNVPVAQVERMADLRSRAMERTELTLMLIGITGSMAALLGLIGHLRRDELCRLAALPRDGHPHGAWRAGYGAVTGCS